MKPMTLLTGVEPSFFKPLRGRLVGVRDGDVVAVVLEGGSGTGPGGGSLHLHVNLGEGCVEKLRENLGALLFPKDMSIFFWPL